jgi:hypothetical protein
MLFVMILRLNQARPMGLITEVVTSTAMRYVSLALLLGRL